MQSISPFCARAVAPSDRASASSIERAFLMVGPPRVRAHGAPRKAYAGRSVGSARSLLSGRGVAHPNGRTPRPLVVALANPDPVGVGVRPGGRVGEVEAAGELGLGHGAPNAHRGRDETAEVEAARSLVELAERHGPTAAVRDDVEGGVRVDVQLEADPFA